MDFTGPDAADYANTRSLNRAFLSLARTAALPAGCLQGLSAPHVARLAALTDPQTERLAETPFLLFSFREGDPLYWDRLFADSRSRDLFVLPAPPDEFSGLVAAGLGFVWQLAQKNPYAARIICGASLHWCERLSERTLVHVLAAAGTRSDLVLLRAAQDSQLWSKLLGNGVDREILVRHAAQLCALHSLLTGLPTDQRRILASAARRMEGARYRVADEHGD